MNRIVTAIALAAIALALVAQANAQLTERVHLPLLAGPTATPIPSPTPQPTPTIGPAPEPFFGDCFSNPNPNRAANTPVRIVNIDRGGSSVVLRNVTGEPVDLTGWTICAVGSNQGWDLSGRSIAPNGLTQILRPQDPIWVPRPLGGALYDNTGRFIAYYTFQF